ncbi:MAG: 4Fe-4S dicluster domain-containing protein [Chloroflexi bacterium]|nr:4Fe-4S dicluster domain-containing protein [Chloroflexota bacterium]
MKHYVMVIDLQACTGCNTCSVACKQENNLPENVWWTEVLTLGSDGNDMPAGVYPELTMDYLPMGCQHCANAPCVEVCPSTATYRLETGVVVQDPSLCIGCRYCMMVCPFTGVRVFSEDQQPYATSFPTGSNPMIHRPKTVEKCTFCAHRLERGLEPACVETCPMRARTFGDISDPTSEVSELLRTRSHFQLLIEKGTEPSVYYLT